jgi:hypothetical protein
MTSSAGNDQLRIGTQVARNATDEIIANAAVKLTVAENPGMERSGAARTKGRNPARPEAGRPRAVFAPACAAPHRRHADGDVRHGLGATLAATPQPLDAVLVGPQAPTVQDLPPQDDERGGEGDRPRGRRHSIHRQLRRAHGVG